MLGEFEWRLAGLGGGLGFYGNQGFRGNKGRGRFEVDGIRQLMPSGMKMQGYAGSRDYV